MTPMLRAAGALLIPAFMVMGMPAHAQETFRIGFEGIAMMFAASSRQTVLLCMLVALPTTATAQAPTLSSQVPDPGETSSITTIEGGEKTTTSCRTDTQTQHALRQSLIRDRAPSRACAIGVSKAPE